MGRGGQLELGWSVGRGRPPFPGRHPVHATLRCVDGIPLRRGEVMGLVCTTIRDANADDFRLCEFDLEPNHLHLIVEASGAASLAHGLQRFQSMLARRLNALVGRSGRVFSDRYHANVLATPTQVRHALRYVLNNRRHHAADAGDRLPEDWFDPFSSAAWFTGWSAPLVATTAAHRAALALPRPTAVARTWLLSVGWRRLGLLSPSEIPGGTRRLEQHEAELAHQHRMLAIDREWRAMRGELLVLGPDL